MHGEKGKGIEGEKGGKKRVRTELDTSDEEAPDENSDSMEEEPLKKKFSTIPPHRDPAVRDQMKNRGDIF